MIMRTHLRITRGGQVSVPAAIRKRWNTSMVIAEDEGDRLVLRPAPDDPVDALMGIFAGDEAGLSTAEARRLSREEEAEAEERRFGR
jgi:bifunctional DNA-binding transcriptional regulator/antitoxin component of YhaV-PrlF toxin-antitoxin module